MISSDMVDAPARSLADQLSDLSQRFETGSEKITPANYHTFMSAAKLVKLGHGESRTDLNSVAMTNKPSHSLTQWRQPSPYKKTSTTMTKEMIGDIGKGLDTVKQYNRRISLNLDSMVAFSPMNSQYVQSMPISPRQNWSNGSKLPQTNQVLMGYTTPKASK